MLCSSSTKEISGPVPFKSGEELANFAVHCKAADGIALDIDDCLCLGHQGAPLQFEANQDRQSFPILLSLGVTQVNIEASTIICCQRFMKELQSFTRAGCCQDATEAPWGRVEYQLEPCRWTSFSENPGES